MRVGDSNNSSSLQGGVQMGAGFTVQQWVLLLFAFFLGIASVMTIDKIFLSNSGHAGAVHAGVVLESGVNPNPDK
ncbi:MAG: hypothetical protein LBB88_05290 [Planctomycetaceae bacterium]|jgi:hypothetical protein|nr:hypothetical protein [Planctomycetaceae bacterium]